jgi:hypothetical protein
VTENKQPDSEFGIEIIKLPPCGRGGPCEAVIEGDQIVCVTCGCCAPRRANPPVAQSNDPLRAVLDGFMQGQMNFFEFLRQQEPPPGTPGVTRNKDDSNER